MKVKKIKKINKLCIVSGAAEYCQSWVVGTWLVMAVGEYIHAVRAVKVYRGTLLWLSGAFGDGPTGTCWGSMVPEGLQWSPGLFQWVLQHLRRVLQCSASVAASRLTSWFGWFGWQTGCPLLGSPAGIVGAGPCKESAAQAIGASGSTDGC
ncbi:hypothetical protein RirG_044870 [Rhizophagus irregularis DAOM 197198w]|uniref:Uncharacterized protein n=1 Tax=Rhizophagus irregularis (strain DAOM 197198w) TaxID=1432141 RepID=A0A015L627_RHIIW|nr:hypothetical protein RirG_044870 [Rhizophagus irregularis DAOM 197198w]